MLLFLIPAILNFWHGFAVAQAAFHAECSGPTLSWCVQGEICDIDGNCVDAAEDELFKLTTKEGKLSVEREKVTFSQPCSLKTLLPVIVTSFITWPITGLQI